MIKCKCGSKRFYRPLFVEKTRMVHVDENGKPTGQEDGHSQIDREWWPNDDMDPPICVSCGQEAHDYDFKKMSQETP